MLLRISKVPFILCALVFIMGCATTGPTVSTTPLKISLDDVPEKHLLDVGILTFEISSKAKKKAKKNDTQAEIKKAESFYIPVHLKNTLQLSAHWGAVHVTPVQTDGVDVHVSGEIQESNGYKLRVRIHVKDATGKTWLNKRYTGRAGEQTYETTQHGEVDAFQDVYNRIANDIIKTKEKLLPKEIEKIRTVSAIKFAKELSPVAFTGYIDQKKNGKVTLLRLPAKEDPMFQRLMKIRQREYMLLDTVNQHYILFYDQMWDPYEKWRELDRTETLALKKVQRAGWGRLAFGVALIAGAILLDNDSGIGSSGVAQQVMVIGGMEVMKSGINITREAKMHSAAVEEIGESFSAEVRPVVIQVEGETIRLRGSADQQYEQWRELLNRIYIEETGIEPIEPGGLEAPLEK